MEVTEAPVNLANQHMAKRKPNHNRISHLLAQTVQLFAAALALFPMPEIMSKLQKVRD